MRLIATIEGCDIIEHDDLRVTFTAKAAIDGDGSGPSHGDPCFQPDTTFHRDGRALNSDLDRFIAVPPGIIQGVAGKVIGCKAEVSYRGRTTDVVVGDIGPRKKLGEMSIACAKALGIPSSPLSGGIQAHEVSYTLWPGIPAKIVPPIVTDIIEPA